MAIGNGSEMAEQSSESNRSPNDVDFDAARRALARNWPDLAEGSPKYLAFCKSLAEFHREFGVESFELRYGLRPPKDQLEEWDLQFMQGAISEEQFGALLKADAERPIDLKMLDQVHGCYESSLENYSKILQGVVLTDASQGDRDDRHRHLKVDQSIAALSGKMPVWKEHLETVFQYLEKVRIGSGRGLVSIGEFEGTSAHWVTQLVFTRTVQAWKACSEISRRSHSDPRYLYAAAASELFRERCLPSLPNPQALYERMREECVLARMNLETESSPSLAIAGSQHVAGSANGIDNESRELTLLGNVFVIVGAAGHIFRPTSNSDWGIDGEVEFKDVDGNPSGRRVYLQLKSGNSHLVKRKGDGAEVFKIAKARHAQYWQQHAYPVMLVIRKSDGSINWMNVSTYLQAQSKSGSDTVRQIVFSGEPFTAANVKKLGDVLTSQQAESTSEAG